MNLYITMSVGVPLGYQQLEPWLDAESLILLSQLDPSYKRKQEIEAQLQNQDNFRMYSAENPDAYALSAPEFANQVPITRTTAYNDVTQGNPLGPGFMSGKGQDGGQSAGFIQALLPFLPLIGSVVGPLVNEGAKALFGMLGPKRGKGISAPNYGGMLMSNPEATADLERTLARHRGKPFWNQVRSAAVDQLEAMVPSIAPQVKPQMRKKIAEMTIEKMLPRSFAKIASETKGKGAGKDFSLPHVAAPVCHWIMRKAFADKSKADAMYRKIRPEILATSGEGIMAPNYKIGSGKFWEQLKAFVKGAFNKAMPVLGETAKKALPAVIEALLKNFGSHMGDALGERVFRKQEAPASSTGDEDSDLVDAPTSLPDVPDVGQGKKKRGGKCSKKKIGGKSDKGFKIKFL